MTRNDMYYLKKVASIYSKKLPAYSILCYNDLYQEGYLVLIHCRKAYNPNMRAKYTTYFIHCLKLVLAGMIAKEAKLSYSKKSYQDNISNNSAQKDTSLDLIEAIDSLSKLLNSEAKAVLRAFTDFPKVFSPIRFNNGRIKNERAIIAKHLDIPQHRVTTHLRNIKLVLEKGL
jgi:DNA-directed RNA polymerase specialized sigma subunit|tara:strand:+ start:82 stop:600 length:519 start_codon:yes stop_codon:yes gene_type:complete